MGFLTTTLVFLVVGINVGTDVASARGRGIGND